MKLLPLLIVAVAVSLVSCSTAKKKGTAAAPAGLRDILTLAEPVPESTIESLKAIANDPSSLLPPAALAEALKEADESASEMPKLAGADPSASAGPVFDVRKEWKRSGINPDEVNPGDVFHETAGPVLHKTLSLVDELSPEERKTLLDHYTVSRTSRVPLTITKTELAALKEELTADFPLPTRSVALDFRSETRSLQGAPYLQLLEALQEGESGGAVESTPHRARLKEQIATMKKQLNSGERLFLVTGVVESEKLRAIYPGAPLGSRDAALIRNAIAGLYPHLINLEASKVDDAVELVAPPRILWEFDSREIKLEGGKLVIDFESVVQI